eukprot:6814050-Pyramimonas_sp.AAC.1
MVVVPMGSVASFGSSWRHCCVCTVFRILAEVEMSARTERGYANISFEEDAKASHIWHAKVTEVDGREYVCADKLNCGFKRICRGSFEMLAHIIE